MSGEKRTDSINFGHRRNFDKFKHVVVIFCKK